MPIPADRLAGVFRTLTILREGFRELGEVDGLPCVPMERRGRIVLPRGTASLLLHVGIPAPALRGGPCTLRVTDDRARRLRDELLQREQTLVDVTTEGVTEIRLEVSRGWSASLAGLPADLELGMLLLDAEILSRPLVPRLGLDDVEGRPRGFLSVRMDLTNQCNMRCRMCPLSFDEIFNQPRSFVSTGDSARIAEEMLPRARQLALSAAYEPLLHPDFPAILEVVHRYAVPFVEFTTNGSLLDAGIANACIHSGVSRVTVSVGGASERTHARIRRGVPFERVLAGVRAFARARQDCQGRIPELSFNKTLIRSNIDELCDVLRLGAAHGLDILHASFMIPHAGLRMELQTGRHRPCCQHCPERQEI